MGADANACRVSLHHVRVLGVGRNLDAIAWARDGVVETVHYGLAQAFDDVDEARGGLGLGGVGAHAHLAGGVHLRGCIGEIVPEKPLYQLVGTVALKSALEDRRFRPLRRDELKDIEVEISVLTQAAPVAAAQDIVVGRDGVILKKDGRSAVFLPQVATEQGWGRDEMLDQLCLKAGLPAGSWKKGAQFLTFQAEVFSEADFQTGR